MATEPAGGHGPGPGPGPGLGARLLLLGLGAAFLVAGVGGWVLRENVHEALKRGFVSRLEERVERVSSRLALAPGGGLTEVRGRGGDEFGQIFSGWYWQLGQLGQPGQQTPSGTAGRIEPAPQAGGVVEPPVAALRSRSLWDAAPIVPSVPAGGLAQVAEAGLWRAHGPRGEALLGLSRPVVVEGIEAQLQLFGPAELIDTDLQRLDRVLVATWLSLVAALAITTWLQVRIGLRPLRRLRGALAAVEAGAAEGVGSGYGRDLDPLAHELDQMLLRNARVVARGRTHAADLSHALKKPLAVLGAEAGMKPNVASDEVLAQVRSMSGLIDRHLARAASGDGEGGAPGGRRQALALSVAPLLALMRSLHQGRDLQWAARLEDGVAWRGEATDLDEMLGNLLDNAGKWARTQVQVSAQRCDGAVALRIEDDGPGLDEQQIAQAARRGRRFDEAVEGSGLGLAITADIAETYGGTLTLDRSPSLGGLRATLTLPR